jgi:hypothetical protein
MPVVFTHLHSFSLFFSWEPLVHLCKSAAQGLLFIFPTATKLTFEGTCANQPPRDCFFYFPHRYQAYF